jgi:GAF domain-containing protein
VTHLREDKCRGKWFTAQLAWNESSCGEKQTDLRGENRVLDLISVGARLPVVLNNLCAAIDLQIGNVVTVIVLPDNAERDLQAIARGFGLHVFWSASIPLRDENVLGSLEMYCCVRRMPSPFELQLIQRATELAGLAIGNHNVEATPGVPGEREWARRLHEAARLN